MSRFSPYQQVRYEDTQLGNVYKSGLEKSIADDLKARRVKFEYEKLKVEYDVPQRRAKYTPDFRLPNGIIIEGKGVFETKDRQKHLLVQAQHPKLDIRFVFSNPNQRISKLSKTTYAMWCAKFGFLFAKGLIPWPWIQEPARPL